MGARESGGTAAECENPPSRRLSERHGASFSAFLRVTGRPTRKAWARLGPPPLSGESIFEGAVGECPLPPHPHPPTLPPSTSKNARNPSDCPCPLRGRKDADPYELAVAAPPTRIPHPTPPPPHPRPTHPLHVKPPSRAPPQRARAGRRRVPPDVGAVQRRGLQRCSGRGKSRCGSLGPPYSLLWPCIRPSPGRHRAGRPFACPARARWRRLPASRAAGPGPGPRVRGGRIGTRRRVPLPWRRRRGEGSPTSLRRRFFERAAMGRAAASCVWQTGLDRLPAVALLPGPGLSAKRPARGRRQAGRFAAWLRLGLVLGEAGA